jgi:hypothetical protein
MPERPYYFPQEFMPASVNSKLLADNYGSQAGAGSVVMPISFGSPNMAPSYLDQQQQIGVDPLQGEVMKPESDLENIQGITDQYYSSVNELNSLAQRAAKMGFNITRPDVMSADQLALSRYYYKKKGEAENIANNLKIGQQNQKMVNEAILADKVRNNPYNQEFGMTRPTSNQDVATYLPSGVNEFVEEKNKSQDVYYTPQSFKEGTQEYEDSRNYLFQNYAGAKTPYEKQYWADQISALETKKYDSNKVQDRALDREALEQKKKEFDLESNKYKDSALSEIRKANAMIHWKKGFTQSGSGDIVSDQYAGYVIGKEKDPEDGKLKDITINQTGLDADGRFYALGSDNKKRYYDDAIDFVKALSYDERVAPFTKDMDRYLADKYDTNRKLIQGSLYSPEEISQNEADKTSFLSSVSKYNTDKNKAVEAEVEFVKDSKPNWFVDFFSSDQAETELDNPVDLDGVKVEKIVYDVHSDGKMAIKDQNGNVLMLGGKEMADLSEADLRNFLSKNYFKGTKLGAKETSIINDIIKDINSRKTGSTNDTFRTEGGNTKISSKVNKTKISGF